MKNEEVKDIVPELFDKIDKTFKLKAKESHIIKDKLKVLKNKKADYKDANEFALEVGKILANTFQDKIKTKDLPDGKMYYNIAKRLIEPNMVRNHDLVSEYSKEVQSILNRQANISIKAQKADLNQDRIDKLVDKISKYDSFDDGKWLLNEPIINFSQAVVDETIKKNANLHYKSGLNPKIIRKEHGNCCDWCKKIVGTYSYPDVPEDIYRRHRHCRCTVDYYPGDGKKQDVWSKKWKDIEKDDKIKERIEKSKPVSYKLANEDIADKLQVQSDEWVHKLSYDEQQAIDDYTDTFYTRINKYLRGLDVSEYFDEYYTKDDLVKSIKNLDSALGKFRLEENITFYRGVSYEELEFLKKSNEIKNFVSLTTDKDTIAKFFIEDYGGGEIIKFNLKKGTKGAYVGTNSANPGEREFILSRNSKYSIKNIKDQWEVTIIEQ